MGWFFWVNQNVIKHTLTQNWKIINVFASDTPYNDLAMQWYDHLETMCCHFVLLYRIVAILVLSTFTGYGEKGLPYTTILYIDLKRTSLSCDIWWTCCIYAHVLTFQLLPDGVTITEMAKKYVSHNRKHASVEIMIFI